MTARIRIVHVITKLDVGGAQETVLATCRLIDPTRYEVTVVCGPEVGAGGGELRTEVERYVPVTVEPSLRRALHPLRDVVAVGRLARGWRHQRPAIVHTHSSKAGVVGRLAAALAGVPVRVHTVHGWSFREHQGRPLRMMYMALERAMARLTTVIVCVAESDRQAGLAARIGRDAQYRVIRSGVDVEGLSARSPSARPVAGPILTVTRLSPPKDTATLVRALARLQHPTTLEVAGEGHDIAALQDLVRSLGLADRVRFLGVRRDVPELLQRAQVFVLSSRSEGFPRAVLEAMAAGVPVIASRVGGVSEVVEHERTGLLVEAGRPDLLASAIDAVLGDPLLADRLRAAASEAVQPFSDRAMVDSLRSAYEEAIRMKAGPRRAA